MSAQTSFAQSAPANPTTNCAWNWDSWLIPNSFVADVDTNYNPTQHIFSPADTSLGASEWYTPSIAPDLSQSLADNVSPTEVVSGTDSERFYGVGFFVSEPNSTRTISWFDLNRNDGHAFAVFNSAGDQIIRAPGVLEGPGSSLASPSYFADPPSARVVLTNNGGIAIPRPHTGTFSFQIPADGKYYIH